MEGGVEGLGEGRDEKLLFNLDIAEKVTRWKVAQARLDGDESPLVFGRLFLGEVGWT